ncbi:hypothetical protein D9756_004396 [Leucocoprinus leucothites]|uniref:Nephrocystin 3-like N-terminal domain-containing protein n=1 Tax=Leucocoprinus leucothites TaxID=201217 RepID=A0A8H5G0D5_9AGAR|nr:hypothetical protein D9756_004396 [Leucoagaricus leucothites]
MPRCSRNFFVKLTHVFEQLFNLSRRAAEPDGAASQACASAPQRPPMPSTQDTALLSQPTATTPITLPSVSPPSTTPTPVPPGVEPPNLATIPVSSPPPAPVSPPTPSLPSLSFTPPQLQHIHAREILQKAHNFTITHSQFNESSPTGFGLERLLKCSMPNAFYNSSARYPPPKCHLGTRNEYIELITNWALGKSDRKEPILWMYGPFGIGKSAVAQSCAEALEPMNKLIATLFFSRSNADRDDPRCVFTSIAYQIATACPSFREIINNRMIEDPALATKSLSTQFMELLVRPLGQVDTAESGLQECVVIIDGLDECRGMAEQCEIIGIVAASADKRTTPFRWFITSRPEDPIIRTMNSPTVSPVCSYIELPVSRAIDHEILVYLTDEFEIIRNDHGLSELWPSKEVFALLVERSAGLWIYVATVTRFIKDENSLGPEEQLRIVIEFVKEVSAKVGPDNPLAEMDFLYTLIMHRVPPKVRTTVQKILLIHSVASVHVIFIAKALCLSAEQLRRACASIQSVMELQGSDLDSMVMNFYHTSFLDFMKDPQRSKELCIHGDFLIRWRRELLEWLHEVCSHNTDSSHIVFPPGIVLPEGVLGADHYENVLGWFWRLCGVSEHPLDSQTAMCLAELPFKNMLRLLVNDDGWGVNAGPVRDNLPVELREKIIRKGKCPILRCINTKDVWILGHGESEAVPRQWRASYGEGFVLENNQDSPEGECCCGAQI